MQSLALGWRLLSRAIVSGIHNEFQLKPRAKVKGPVQFVTGCSGFSKSVSKTPNFKNWSFGDDAYFVAKNTSYDVIVNVAPKNMDYSFSIAFQALLYLMLAEAIKLQCPDRSQWHLRLRAFCSKSSMWYYCLYDKNNQQYKEVCSNQESFHKPGFKYVISGNLNGEPCNRTRYQPFKFSMDGNSDCVFLKSMCSEDGQIVYSNGTTKTDITCRCDYTRGYNFVKIPKHTCYCDPSREDCSCYKKPCGDHEVLTADIHNQHIHDWIKDDDKFIVTSATQNIFERLQRDNCVFVVGIAGNGKSSNIRHIALKLKKQQQYEIIPIVLSPEIIFELRNRNRKQIFIVDDLCGKVNVNAQSVDLWVSQINEIVTLINIVDKNDTKDNAQVKFLFATRLSIYEDSIFQKLKLLMKYVVPLSKFPLTDDEKLKMINKYITGERETKHLNKLKSDAAYFPLLCKIAERKTPDQIVKLFSNLKGFIKQDLMDLKEKNHLQFCTITLCAILNNNFKEEILNDVYESDIEKQAFENICFEFNLGPNKDQVKSKITASQPRWNVYDENGKLLSFYSCQSVSYCCCGVRSNISP
ncbi:Hypothetical predicted protein [Mytilus galloprovincialis]|uniref:Novel STAND NTPase 3 domain-containing protein n=1 Tax=Mytilus galloprovincialis TaxID=29158 RepID=A0A8B6CUC2_MYTGA|nr:Hypothetical predicted protein [Mytilus galloprovincialis]